MLIASLAGAAEMAQYEADILAEIEAPLTPVKACVKPAQPIGMNTWDAIKCSWSCVKPASPAAGTNTWDVASCTFKCV